MLLVILSRLVVIKSFFPGDHDVTKVISENTVNNALCALGYNTKTEVCGHGFRTMVRGAPG